ncbi:hypothetical protein HOD19_01760 [bacterium]|nr:hypothetical protein [bacterium]
MFNKLKKIVYSPKIRYSNRFRGFALNAREEVLKKATMFIQANGVVGDYFEFGVYRGGTFIAAYHFVKNNVKNDIEFLAFDSFKGLPEIKNEDAEDPMYKEGQYSADLDIFKNELIKNNVDLNKVKIFPGWFDKVLNTELKQKLKDQGKKSSIVWVDCDLYESTTVVLDFIKYFLVDGSIVLFDDWVCFKGRPDKGEQKAFSEWLDKNPNIKVSEFHKFGWNGNSFIIHKS